MPDRDTTSPPTNLVPAAPARAEIRVVNSRFIASIAPAASVDAARAFIAAVRAEMPDASHHVHAYLIGHGATTTLGASDDGEPPGTAGRPTLAVLRGSGLGDTALVVTRYFGGTLLGTGGLVRAYGDAAKAVLAIVPRAEKIERRVLELVVEYGAYEPVRRLAAAHAGSILAEQFAADVTLQVRLPLAQLAAFTRQLEELTAGRARVAELPDT
ncbi:YigZ family protein [Kouleothrix sp.]|uniref:YigZ family protein n=1 Tax=Kouleothrix sp. TaxID=2779161 RepID=UPI00391CBC05